MIKYFYFLLLCSLFTIPAYPGEGDIAIGPIIKYSYDINLGTTIGLGFLAVYMSEGVGRGFYTVYSYSKNKRGNNLSIGLYAGMGLASFRVGLNRMVIKEKKQDRVYWGLESTPTFLFVHGQGGIMFENANWENWEKRKLNLSGGVGLF